MVDNIPKNEYNQKLSNQKQLQTSLIEASRKRREEETQTEEEFFEEDEYPNEEVSTQDNNQYLEQKRKPRISRVMGMLLVVSAVLVDLVELVMMDTGLDVFAFGIFGFLLSMCATIAFWIWFQMLSIPYSSNTKRFGASIITSLAEMTPGLDALQIWFVWTLGMIVIVGMVRMEDKGEEPTILGGLSEGLALLLSSNPLNPVAIPIGFALSEANIVRRRLKKATKIGQADWVKEEKEQKRAA